MQRTPRGACVNDDHTANAHHNSVKPSSMMLNMVINLYSSRRTEDLSGPVEIALSGRTICCFVQPLKSQQCVTWSGARPDSKGSDRATSRFEHSAQACVDSPAWAYSPHDTVPSLRCQERETIVCILCFDQLLHNLPPGVTQPRRGTGLRSRLPSR